SDNKNIIEVKIRLFYAGRPFLVRLLYSARQPWMPPDILCDDVNFNDAISLDMMSNQLSSLGRWQEGKLESVADLLSDLHSLYHKYQVITLDVNYCCHSLNTNKRHSCTKTCMLIEQVYSALGEDVLCVKLPIEFEDLPAPLFTEDCGIARCVLELTAATGNRNSYEPSLSLSARAESLLCGDSGDMLRLPPVPPNCTSLVAYASSVIQIINDNIKRVHHAYEIRKQIIAQLLCKYDAAISQYDNVRFKSVQLLLNEDSFHYIVDINFPHGFPHNCSARVHLRSISQTDNDQPASAMVPNMSHAGETDPDELLSLIMQAASSFAPTFKRQH
ncbi:BRCA1-A complex subunit BRE, partial [Trinorchestia longiramus]